MGKIDSSQKEKVQSLLGKISGVEKDPDRKWIVDNLMPALIEHESNYNPKIQSGAGAKGLLQLMPDTARGLGLRVDSKKDERENPDKSVNAGTRYFLSQWDSINQKYPDKTKQEKLITALRAYNSGPGRVDQVESGKASYSKEGLSYPDYVLGKIPKDKLNIFTGSGAKNQSLLDSLLKEWEQEVPKQAESQPEKIESQSQQNKSLLDQLNEAWGEE